MIPYFVGYPSIEGWHKAIDTENQVYAIMLIESRPGQFSRIERHVISLAQPIDNEVAYCRLCVASTEWIGNSCVSEDRHGREARAAQAWEMVKKWLVEKNLQWHEASVTVPMELRDGLLDGHAEFMSTGWKTKPVAVEPSLGTPLELTEEEVERRR